MFFLTKWYENEAKNSVVWCSWSAVTFKRLFLHCYLTIFPNAGSRQNTAWLSCVGGAVGVHLLDNLLVAPFVRAVDRPAGSNLTERERLIWLQAWSQRKALEALASILCFAGVSATMRTDSAWRACPRGVGGAVA